MKTIIKRTPSFYRPYTVNGQEIKQIVFYKDDQVIFSAGHGWLEKLNTPDVNEHYNMVDITEIELEGEVKKSTKKNLSRKDHFIIKEKCFDWSFGAEYCLYIYVDGIDVIVEKLKEKYIQFESDLDKTYYQNYRIKLYDLDFITMKYESTEKKDFYYRCKEISDKLKEKENLDIHYYDIEKILKHYNLTEKKIKE